jgi:hypothetical protein
MAGAGWGRRIGEAVMVAGGVMKEEGTEEEGRGEADSSEGDPFA